MFVRGGTPNGGRIRISHRNWLNPQTNTFRWGDAYLDWGGAEPGQAQPPGGVGGGSPVDWTTSLAQGQNQPYVWMKGYGIAGENTFGQHYWMLDADMDCEQAVADGAGRRWFEIKAFLAPTPGWEGNITQTSTPMPPFASINHVGVCGMINVFVANFPNLPPGLNPNTAQFRNPTYTYATPVDERNASIDVLTKTPCVSPGLEKRCLGNIAQSCQSIDGGTFFRSVQECNAIPSFGNFVQMCQPSKGECCTPVGRNICP
jgi:hypothetical protein